MKRVKYVVAIVAAILLIVPQTMTAFAVPATDSPSNNVNPGQHKALALGKINKLKDGGCSYEYNVNGLTITEYAPPAGFDPTTATDAQLAEYGIAPPPSDSNGKAHWNQQMKAIKSYVTPDITVEDETNTTPPADSVPNNMNDAQTGSNNSLFTSISSNWAGYEASGSTGFPWAEVEGEFTQPSNTAPGDFTNEEASWIGLGGWATGSTMLAQVGTAMNAQSNYDTFFEFIVQSSGSKTPTYNMQVFDLFSASGITSAAGSNSNSMQVSPGNVMYFSLTYQSAKQFLISIQNKSTGKIANFTVTPTNGSGTSNPSGTIFDSYDGSSAEWIEERPYVPSSITGYKNLSDFGTISWSYCEVFLGSTVSTLASTTHALINMNDGSANMTSVSAVGSDGMSFTDKWVSAS